MKKIKVAIIGPGNIGTDLMYKILKSKKLKMAMMIGIFDSEGIKRARNLNIKTSINGLDELLKEKDIKIVFDATGAKSHMKHAPLLKEAGKITIDLTPAAIGPFVVPCINLNELKSEQNFNMITCGGQATIPIVYAINRVSVAEYAEIVASISSYSAGPSTRSNIDEFTQTTAKAISTIGGTKKGKAIIILNPAKPPVMMKNTIYVEVKNPDKKAIEDSVKDIVREIQEYVPGYQLRVPPLIDEKIVTTIIQIEGAGDFLPRYSGNLDIMNSAAIRVAEKLTNTMFNK